ncbi:undecaprenyl-diphosphate phosphatase [Hathewaya limosa]|uniref:Undecaprenyl-diphosphatase n=1 Tax=Hathewaya limosa TaxID=1536 RepID=A0ABU0JN42_HATLI|nr:undecaprenyl-diphosphate phosphatase [Hathewaya limosa]AWZ49229.1 undecaprenyl-diphosphatase [Clostridiaceae bacterium 14S0207]MDQ0478483.1 undecaprenyl-diphosphatase [Hathewaya limosa]
MDLLFIFKAIIIAIVEGITEFLPISSTGHMIIVGHVINFTGEFAKLFEVVIQLGAILAIVVLYWNKIWTSIIKFFKLEHDGLKFWFNILIAVIPAGVLGFLFDDIIDEKLMNPQTVAAALIFGAILMIIIEYKYRNRNGIDRIEEISYSKAFIIGVFQCLALWPGMSRSASTIMGAWLMGVTTVAAAEFSFFLAIPTMVGASGLKLIKAGFTLNFGEIVALIVGFVVAFIVALIVVEKFMNFLKKRPMKGFAIYRLILGGIIVALMFTNFFK